MAKTTAKGMTQQHLSFHLSGGGTRNRLREGPLHLGCYPCTWPFPGAQTNKPQTLDLGKPPKAIQRQRALCLGLSPPPQAPMLRLGQGATHGAMDPFRSLGRAVRQAEAISLGKPVCFCLQQLLFSSLTLCCHLGGGCVCVVLHMVLLLFSLRSLFCKGAKRPH